jgi:hypothetical protein
MTTAALEPAEALELGYALIARVAEDLGVRALAIKGLVHEAHDLREPRASADVDVLVEPGRHAHVVAALIEAGWRMAPQPTVPPPFGYHSVTLNHPSWPCELDVHDRFPGFLADPADVFDTLWTHHSFIVAAGVAVPSTDLYASALLLALHALRTPRDPRNARELIGLVDRLSSRKIDLGRLRTLAEATGALATARPVLVALGATVPAVSPDDPSVLQWELRRAHRGTRNLGWLVELRRTAPWRWPGLLVSTFLSTEPMLRKQFPAAPPGPRGLWVARRWRLRLALKDLPKALRVVRRIR